LVCADTGDAGNAIDFFVRIKGASPGSHAAAHVVNLEIFWDRKDRNSNGTSNVL
jgi:hypothetical protein